MDFKVKTSVKSIRVEFYATRLSYLMFCYKREKNLKTKKCFINKILELDKKLTVAKEDYLQSVINDFKSELDECINVKWQIIKN